ncbi:MAG: phosphatase PAP2 family protein [Myxococcota bacterium]
MSRERRRPYRFELFALGMAGGVALVLLAAGLPFATATAGGARRVAILALTLFGVGAVVGVGLQCAGRALVRRPVAPYLEALRGPGWWWLWGRLWLACMLGSSAYFWLKVYVPRLHPGTLDASLWSLDRAFHLGVSPTHLTIEHLPRGLVGGVLDPWYGLWLLTLFAGIAFFAASERADVRRGAMLSFLALWTLGAVGYVLLPVVGPVFAFPGPFRDLPADMPIAAATQQLLWDHYRGVADGGPVRDYTRGVGALPSLHVGFHVLFALWARRVAPRLAPLLWVAVLLTGVGSVRSGWHYAVDAYAGAACAWLAFRLGLALEGVRGEPGER